MEQFGLAIIFFFEYPVIASAFTSGTINGTLGSYLYRELLSITIQFLAAAFGANFLVGHSKISFEFVLPIRQEKNNLQMKAKNMLIIGYQNSF